MRSRAGMLGGAALVTLVLFTRPIASQDPLEGVGFALGDARAPVTIVEFGDFGCSACAQFATNTWPVLHTELVQSGRVRWRFVPMAFGFRHSAPALQAALCADAQGAFWPMHDLLYARQKVWQRERDPLPQFRELARELELDLVAFEACYPTKEIRQRIKALTAVGKRQQIPGTPAFRIGERWIYGAQPLEVFRSAVAR